MCQLACLLIWTSKQILVSRLRYRVLRYKWYQVINLCIGCRELPCICCDAIVHACAGTSCSRLMHATYLMIVPQALLRPLQLYRSQ